MEASKIRVGMCVRDDLDPELLLMVTARDTTQTGLIRLHLGRGTFVAADPTDEVEVFTVSGCPL